MRIGPTRRNSLRLESYDYTWPGAYFVTICIADRMPRFGDVIDGLMRVNDAGMMIDNQWHRLPGRFPHVALDAYTVMPNHLHAILDINTNTATGSETLSAVLGAFKSFTTRAYAEGVQTQDWPPFDGHLWQRSFHDHIIRDDRDLDRVRAYIAANPARWHEDHEYRARLHLSPPPPGQQDRRPA